MPTDGTGLPFVEAATSVRRRFWAALSDKQSARPSQQATPFPFEHLMNNFRIGAIHRDAHRGRIRTSRGQFALTSRRLE